MQMQPVFSYYDYKKYILDRIASWPGGERGVRKQLAQAIGCQVGFITHVLAGPYHFSPEQAERSSRFLNLNREEAEFFVTLVQHNRAGTRELRELFESSLGKKREKNLKIKNRIKIQETLSREDQTIYYRSWHYAAIHMLTTVSEFQNVAAIAHRLHLSPKTVNRVVEFLLSRGLLKTQSNRLVPTGKYLHLEKSSPLLDQHLRNLHLFAIERLQESSGQAIHYAAFMSCSRSDYEKIREKLLRCLEECAELVKPSKEEELVALNIDWYPV